MAIFNSYVKLPEGKIDRIHPSCVPRPLHCCTFWPPAESRSWYWFPYLWLLKSRFQILQCWYIHISMVYSIHLCWFWGWFTILALTAWFCMQVKDKTFHWISYILIPATTLLVQVLRWNPWRQHWKGQKSQNNSHKPIQATWTLPSNYIDSYIMSSWNCKHL